MDKIPEEMAALLETAKQIQQKALESLSEPLRSKMIVVHEFRSWLTYESDRGCALMATAYLDEQLEQLIRAKLIDDTKVVNGIFEGQGALTTFSSRIDIAYLLGLIPKNAQRDLHLVRKIRNEFAHLSENVTFEKPEIASRCKELYFNGMSGSVSPRSMFTRAMMGLLGLIQVTAIKTKHEEVVPEFDIEATRAGAKMFYDLLKAEGYQEVVKDLMSDISFE